MSAPEEAGAWPGPALLDAFGAATDGAVVGDAGLDARVSLVVPPHAGRPRRGRRAAGGEEGAPAVTVQGTLTVVGGRIEGWAPGEAADPTDATMTLPAADARAVLAGDVEPSVLFMQGKLKVDGDMRPVLALLEASASAAFAAGRDRLASAGA